MIGFPSQSSLIHWAGENYKDDLQSKEGKAFSSQVVVSFIISCQTSLAQTGSTSGDQQLHFPPVPGQQAAQLRVPGCN